MLQFLTLYLSLLMGYNRRVFYFLTTIKTPFVPLLLLFTKQSHSKLLIQVLSDYKNMGYNLDEAFAVKFYGVLAIVVLSSWRNSSIRTNQ
jgi:hypothetical protein